MVTHAVVTRPDLYRLGAQPDLDARAVLVWRFDATRESLSSAPVGGGWRRIDWLVNLGVAGDYSRTDLDAHAAEIATHLGLTGPGQVLMTAADVTMGVEGACDDVRVDATVGITKPTWAAAADDSFAHRVDDVWVPGTINIVVQMPVPLSPAAAVNAVVTATEAKTQALVEASIPGTGTASDAVTIVWPSETAGLAAEAFAGPRSTWGARLGRAIHRAITNGIAVHP